MEEGAAPPLPIGKPSYEGSLYKRSEWLQQWRQRYFKLYLGPSGPRLYFCKDQESPPHGAIDLRQCLTVKSADDKTGKKNSFEVSTSEQHFFMYANTAQEKDDVRINDNYCSAATGARRDFCGDILWEFFAPPSFLHSLFVFLTAIVTHTTPLLPHH
jgi:hypothetical protein